jgi:tyrosyl-tRNA synthetase
MKSAKEQIEIIGQGSEFFAGSIDLERRIEEQIAGLRGPLRVKAGFDPTRPDLHLGHVVILRKLRQIQDLGHNVIFIIGDFTATIGDPTGRDAARPRMTPEEVRKAAATYQAQCFKVLDENRTRVYYNADWLGGMTLPKVLELAALVPVPRILGRDDFKGRLAEKQPLHLHELFYPLLQAYDSYIHETDLEVGGSDQLFNLHMGRDLMLRYNKFPQAILGMPLLEGLDARVVDGKILGKKMSKGADNYIGITEDPFEVYHKVMRLDDGLVWRYLRLAAGWPEDSKTLLKEGDPRWAKGVLARDLITQFHGEEEALAAEAEFQKVYGRGGTPSEVAEVTVEPQKPSGVWVAKALSLAGLTPTTGGGSRLILNGYVEADGVRVTDERACLAPGGTYLLRVGTKVRTFARVTVPAFEDETVRGLRAGLSEVLGCPVKEVDLRPEEGAFAVLAKGCLYRTTYALASESLRGAAAVRLVDKVRNALSNSGEASKGSNVLRAMTPKQVREGTSRESKVLSKQKAHTILRKDGLKNEVDYRLWGSGTEAEGIHFMRPDLTKRVFRLFWKEGWLFEVVLQKDAYLRKKPELSAEEAEAFESISHDAARGEIRWKSSEATEALARKGFFWAAPGFGEGWYELNVFGRMYRCGLQIDRDGAV